MGLSFVGGWMLAHRQALYGSTPGTSGFKIINLPGLVFLKPQVPFCGLLNCIAAQSLRDPC